MVYRNRAYLNTAKGQPCIRCGMQNGTTVSAHYCGIGQGRLGKGTGIKPHDVVVAHLCNDCHEEFDQYKNENDYERSWEFLMLCFETLARNLKDGIKL